MPSRVLLYAAVLLGLWLATGSAAHAGLIPQNQCPGDCSPCLGPTDPFCTAGGGSGTGGGGGTTTTCQICETIIYEDGSFSEPRCASVGPGESGYTSCSVTRTATTVTCSATGTACTVAR